RLMLTVELLPVEIFSIRSGVPSWRNSWIFAMRLTHSGLMRGLLSATFGSVPASDPVVSRLVPSAAQPPRAVAAPKRRPGINLLRYIGLPYVLFLSPTPRRTARRCEPWRVSRHKAQSNLVTN